MGSEHHDFLIPPCKILLMEVRHSSKSQPVVFPKEVVAIITVLCVTKFCCVTNDCTPLGARETSGLLEVRISSKV